jgi:hypothetical protein
MFKIVRNILVISLMVFVNNASASEDQITLLGQITSINEDNNIVLIVGEKIYYKNLKTEINKGKIKVGDDIYVRGKYKSDVIVAEILVVVIMEESQENFKIDSSVCCDLPQKNN